MKVDELQRLGRMASDLGRLTCFLERCTERPFPVHYGGLEELVKECGSFGNAKFIALIMNTMIEWVEAEKLRLTTELRKHDVEIK